MKSVRFEVMPDAAPETGSLYVNADQLTLVVRFFLGPRPNVEAYGPGLFMVIIFVFPVKYRIGHLLHPYEIRNCIQPDRLHDPGPPCTGVEV